MHSKNHEKERTSWEDRIINYENEPKRLGATLFNTLLGLRRVQPDCSSGATLALTAEDFLTTHTNYRILAVYRIHGARALHRRTNCSLSSLNEVTTEKLRRIIIYSLPKSCQLHPSQPSCFKNTWMDLLLPLLKDLSGRVS